MKGVAYDEAVDCLDEDDVLSAVVPVHANGQDCVYLFRATIETRMVDTDDVAARQFIALLMCHQAYMDFNEFGAK